MQRCGNPRRSSTSRPTSLRLLCYRVMLCYPKHALQDRRPLTHLQGMAMLLCGWRGLRGLGSELSSRAASRVKCYRGGVLLYPPELAAFLARVDSPLHVWWHCRSGMVHVPNFSADAIKFLCCDRGRAGSSCFCSATVRPTLQAQWHSLPGAPRVDACGFESSAVVFAG